MIVCMNADAETGAGLKEEYEHILSPAPLLRWVHCWITVTQFPNKSFSVYRDRNQDECSGTKYCNAEWDTFKKAGQLALMLYVEWMRLGSSLVRMSVQHWLSCYHTSSHIKITSSFRSRQLLHHLARRNDAVLYGLHSNMVLIFMPEAICFARLCLCFHQSVCLCVYVSVISPVSVDGFSPNSCHWCILGQKLWFGVKRSKLRVT